MQIKQKVKRKTKEIKELLMKEQVKTFVAFIAFDCVTAALSAAVTQSKATTKIRNNAPILFFVHLGCTKRFLDFVDGFVDFPALRKNDSTLYQNAGRKNQP